MSTNAERMFAGMAGLPMTVAEVHDFKDKCAGLSPLGVRNLDRFIYGAEVRVQNQKDDAVRRVESLRDEIAVQIEDALDAAKADARRVERDVRAGRLTVDEGRRQAAQVADVVKEANARLQQLFKTDDDLHDLAEMDPAAYEADLVDRYPGLRRSLPVLTEEELNRAD